MSIIVLEILNWPGDRNAGTSRPSQLVSPSLPCCLTAESGKARVSLPTPQYVPRTWRRPPVENARAATHQQIHLGRPRQAVAAQPFTVKICPGPWGRRIASLGPPTPSKGREAPRPCRDFAIWTDNAPTRPSTRRPSSTSASASVCDSRLNPPLRLNTLVARFDAPRLVMCQSQRFR